MRGVKQQNKAEYYNSEAGIQDRIERERIMLELRDHEETYVILPFLSQSHKLIRSCKENIPDSRFKFCLLEKGIETFAAQPL